MRHGEASTLHPTRQPRGIPVPMPFRTMSARLPRIGHLQGSCGMTRSSRRLESGPMRPAWGIGATRLWIRTAARFQRNDVGVSVRRLTERGAGLSCACSADPLGGRGQNGLPSSPLPRSVSLPGDAA